MEPTEAIAFVRHYNAWRRNDNDSIMPHPKDIGQALDALCDHAERLERGLNDAKAALAACREDSAELLGERNWWKDEVRKDYQKRYYETAENIVVADSILSQQ